MAEVLIVGMGQVGRAIQAAFTGVHTMSFKDLNDNPLPKNVDVMHICLRYDTMDDDKFLKTVLGYAREVKPKMIDICSTVAPGTSEYIELRTGIPTMHSTTRGLHPRIDLRKITKHIGGPEAGRLAEIYNQAGVPTITHKSARTTELAHILNNLAYGVNLVLADELQSICRDYGVDYFEAVMLYTKTNNQGFEAMDNPTKVRMILTPPGGVLGGHCVVQSANLLEKHVLDKSTFAKVVAGYGTKAPVITKK